MAMKGEEAYALSLGYTDDSIRGISGVLAGKNCVVKEIVDNKVTFQWTADDGTVRTNTMTVDATTPIDQIEDEVARWCEENKEDIKGQDGIDGVDGKTVQVLGDDETDDDIVDEAVLIFNPKELQVVENYSKAQADSRFAKRVDVGNVNSLAVSTWTDLVTAINDVYSKGMGAYRFECNEYTKTLTLICRNGVEFPIDISQIILNTNIEELKNMLVTNILDGQSLVYNASKKKWVNKSIDSSGVLVEAKQYTDDEIKKINNKGQIAVDGKPTYYGGVITYRKGGETKTTENTGTWFYYYDDNNKAVQTIWIEGTEFTIAMAGDINLDDYIAQTEKIDIFDENFTDKTKVPTTRYIEELKGIIDDEIADKVNITDIEDSLTSDATDKPLSAKQGKELNSTKLNKTTDVENSGKALVVDENGNIVFGDAGVKVSSEEGNKITEKDDGIFVASEIDDESTDEDKVWSAKKVNDSLVDINANLGELSDSFVDKVPFKFGITEDGQYGYIKDGADTVTPFKSAKHIGGYGMQSKVTLPTKGEYILSAISYSSAGASTAKNYTQLNTVSDGTFERLTDTTGGSYSVRAYKVTANSDNAVCTFNSETNITVTKIG